MNILKILSIPFIALASWLHVYTPPPAPIINTPAPISVGAALPQGVAVFETSLQSAITSSATSMLLTANAVSGGSTLSGFNCFTIDEGSTQAEYVCGTVSGTTVSSMTRGVDPVTATTTNATLQFAHRRGANIKITDFPLIQILRNQLNGNDTIPNIISYVSGVDCTGVSASNSICGKSYVDSVAVAGASNATESVKGIAELATRLEQASSTAFGSTAASTILQAKYATSTYNAGAAGGSGLNVVVTRNNNTIDPNFIATSSTDIYNFGSINIASSTIASTTAFNINVGTINATSSIKIAGVAVPASADVQVFTGSGTWTKLANAKYVLVQAWGGGGAGGGVDAAASEGAGGGGGGAYAEERYQASDLTSTVSVTIGAGGVGVSANTGGVGGNTTFGSYVTAPGGNGGLKGSAGTGGIGGVGGASEVGVGSQIYAGGAAGGGGGGAGQQSLYGGGGGGSGPNSSGSGGAGANANFGGAGGGAGTPTGGTGGTGGTAKVGYGGTGGTGATGNNSGTFVGSAATGVGSGGGGSCQGGGAGGAAVGGAGFRGQVIVTTFF